MQTFLMIGKYSSEAIKDVSANRTVKAKTLIQQLGGQVRSMHALLGDYDVVFFVDLPNVEIAMKASLGISMLTGISFSTFPAVSVDDLDRIMGEL